MKNRFLFTALALLCGATTALAGSPSVPKGEWIIGPINATSSSGVGYCSMKNEYTNGYTLVFARDAEGSNSLAIDFHQKVLETGGQYTVGLKVGPLQREMLAIAATPSVFIIQMGLDRDFYMTLQRRASLQVDFQTAQMSFGLDGTRDGLAALTSCAQAVGVRKKFAQVHVPLTKAPDEKTLAATEPAAGEAPVLPPANFPDQAQTADAAAPANTGEMSGNLGEQAAEATLEDQIKRLKAENRKLLLENQRVAETLQNDGPPTVAAPVAPVEEARLPVPPRPVFTGGARKQDAASPDNVAAALVAAQEGIQQALEATQKQAEESRQAASIAAENARLKKSLAAAQAEAENARRQAAMLAENAKLKEQLAAEQQAKQHALDVAQQQAAEVKKQAAIAAENAKLKEKLEAQEQEKQRAVEAARAQAEAEAKARQKAAEAAEAEEVKAKQRAAAETQAKAERAEVAAALDRQRKADIAAAEEKRHPQAKAAEVDKTASAEKEEAKVVVEQPKAADAGQGTPAAAEPAEAADAGPVVSLPLESPKTVVEPVKTVEAPRSAPRKSLEIVNESDNFVQSLLSRSHLAGHEDPRNPGTWSWSAAGVNGQAREIAMTAGTSLPEAVDTYVKTLSKTCHGDFAHKMGAAKAVGGAEVIEGEVACINGVSDAAAAVLFISRDGKLDIISHGGPPSHMEKALSERDTVISAIAE